MIFLLVVDVGDVFFDGDYERIQVLFYRSIPVEFMISRVIHRGEARNTATAVKSGFFIDPCTDSSWIAPNQSWPE
jgi:hypothetical protein